MAKSKKRSKKVVTKRASKGGAIIRYESGTFLLFLAFVVLVSMLLVARMFGIY